MNANDLNNPLIYEHYASAIYALFVATSHIYIFHFNVNSISCIKCILEVWSTTKIKPVHTNIEKQL